MTLSPQDDAAPTGPPLAKPSFLRAYSFAIVTGGFFLISWAGQAIFQFIALRQDAREHGEQLTTSDFLSHFLASTLENWQSEFLQLVWQAAGLALFYFWGSSQSRESDDRLEAKVDLLLEQQNIDPETLRPFSPVT